jgi:hypothetical protein
LSVDCRVFPIEFDSVWCGSLIASLELEPVTIMLHNLSTELICTSTHRPSSIHVPSSKKSKEGSRSVMLVVTLKGRRRYLATSLTPQAYKIQPNTIPLCAFQKTKIAQRLESNVHCIESNHGTRKNLSPSLSTDCWSTLCIRWAQGCHR